MPREKNPTRVVLTQDEYEALLEVSRDVDWRFHVALVLAHETGHRAGAVAGLRWPDLDLGAGLVRWRAWSWPRRADGLGLGIQAAERCFFSKLRGDIWPSDECRRWGLYQASMKSKTAMRTSA